MSNLLPAGRSVLTGYAVHVLRTSPVPRGTRLPSDALRLRTCRHSMSDDDTASYTMHFDTNHAR